MKTLIYLAGIWLLVFLGISIIAIDSASAQDKSKQKTTFDILSGKIDVVAILTNLPEDKDSESSLYDFDIIVKAKDMTFSVPTSIIGVSGSDEAVSRIKEGTEWKEEYLFVPSECGGGTSRRCNTNEVFAIRDNRLIRIGSIVGSYENGVFYDEHGLGGIGLVSHVSAPYITRVMREVGGSFVVDLDLTWEENQQQYEGNIKTIESADNQPATEVQEDETLVAAILFNAGLAKYCDHKEELESFIREAKATLDDDQFSRFNNIISRVKPGLAPGE